MSFTNIQTDVLLVTVNEHETRAVMRAFEAAAKTVAVNVTVDDRVYRDLGTVNGMRFFHALSEMGSGGLGAAQQSVEKAIRALSPHAVIAVGIAFGIDEAKQKIGDILLSRQLRPYDLQRVGAKIALRGDRPHASSRLINYFEGVAQTAWEGPPVHPGIILTGEKLIDNAEFKNQICSQEPDAVGGEMEGTGVYVASHDQKVDWIVVKAICDWADGDKAKNKKARQKKAANAAVQFIVHAFKCATLNSGRTMPTTEPSVIVAPVPTPEANVISNGVAPEGMNRQVIDIQPINVPRPRSNIGTPSINLRDLGLFGNDAAEDESDEVFNAYVLDREELEAFTDPSRRICIAHAYKGEGKSALLRLAATRLQLATDDQLVVRTTGSKLMEPLESAVFAKWVSAWKAAIFRLLADHLARKLEKTRTGDGMGLVDEVEQIGLQEGGLLMAVIKHLIGSKAPERLIEATTGDAEGSPSESLVARWMKGRAPVWIFVDDVDKNFTNTALDRARVASFFDACRELAIAVPEIRIRSAVRPNVWTVVKLEFEALSHVEQYLTALRWSEGQIRSLLARRVAGYLQRTNQGHALRNVARDVSELEMIAHAFQHPMIWGGDGRTRPPHVVLYTLSKHRPRWMIELCKVAAARASSTGHSKIEKDDVILEMGNFGNRRIADTIAEFSSQCSQTDELIAAFRASQEEFTTDGLFRLIENRVLSHVHPKIAGVLGVAQARDVAAFLFQIGLFYGRDEKEDGSYEHITFSDRPSLFRARTAVDDSLVWEIHPVFRQALELRDSYGRETKKSRR